MPTVDVVVGADSVGEQCVQRSGRTGGVCRDNLVLGAIASAQISRAELPAQVGDATRSRYLWPKNPELMAYDISRAALVHRSSDVRRNSSSARSTAA